MGDGGFKVGQIPSDKSIYWDCFTPKQEEGSGEQEDDASGDEEEEEESKEDNNYTELYFQVQNSDKRDLFAAKNLLDIVSTYVDE